MIDDGVIVPFVRSPRPDEAPGAWPEPPREAPAPEAEAPEAEAPEAVLREDGAAVLRPVTTGEAAAMLNRFLLREGYKLAFHHMHVEVPEANAARTRG